MLNEFTEPVQSLAWMGDQLLKMDFRVVGTKVATVLAPLVHHPLPIKAAGHDRRRAIPRSSLDVTQLVRGKRHIASVPDDMDDQRIGNRLLDPMQVQDMLRRSIGPALDA